MMPPTVQPTQQQLQATPTPQLPPPLTIASQLALADGDIHLAAERLHLDPAVVMQQLTDDPDLFQSLIRQLRAKTAVQVYRDMAFFQRQLADSFDTFEPKDKIAAFKALADLFSNMSTNTAPAIAISQVNQNNFNAMDRILDALPPDARDALHTIIDMTPASTSASTPAPDEPTQELPS